VTVEQALLRRPVAVVVAHPDDETIGAGGILPRLDGIMIHITDGAPRHPAAVRDAGFRTPAHYAAARWRELIAAMKLAGLAPSRLCPLHVADQEASLEMAYLTLKLVHLFREFHPAVILTHSYEGGHPDHDAAAFAVHAACARVPAPPEVYEFASYHAAAQTIAAGGGQPSSRIETGRFLPGTDPGEVIVLDEHARRRKQAMFDCFTTQSAMLANFAIDEERFRPAPAYDFSAAPHAGTLYYENFPWGVTGERWRFLAAEALRTLGAASIL